MKRKRRSIMTRSSEEWSLNAAVDEGRRAIYGRALDGENVEIKRDALRVLVANTEVVIDALSDVAERALS